MEIFLEKLIGHIWYLIVLIYFLIGLNLFSKNNISANNFLDKTGGSLNFKESLVRNDSYTIDYEKSFKISNFKICEYNSKKEAIIEISLPKTLNKKTMNDKYFVLNLYPYDEEKNLLPQSRRKYGFQSHYLKLEEIGNSKINLKALINTDYKRARAAVLLLMQLKTRKKLKEWVMIDLNLAHEF